MSDHDPARGPWPAGGASGAAAHGPAATAETQSGPGSGSRPEHEPELVRLDPRVRSLWWTVGGLRALVLTLVVMPVDVFAPLPWPNWWLTGGVAAVALALAAIVPTIRYRRWGYALREGDLWIRQGVIWVSVSVIPYSRLQFVDTRQGPFDRLFGLSQLVVHTAALGTSGRLPGLDAAEAEQLRERLAAVESDVVAV